MAINEHRFKSTLIKYIKKALYAYPKQNRFAQVLKFYMLLYSTIFYIISALLPVGLAVGSGVGTKVGAKVGPAISGYNIARKNTK